MGIKERRRRKKRAAVMKKMVCIVILLGAVIGVVLGVSKLQQNNAKDKNTAMQGENKQPMEGMDTEETSQNLKTDENKQSDTEKVGESDTETAVNTEEEIVTASHMQSEYQRILDLPAGEMAVNGIITGELTGRLFYSKEIDDAIFSKINGCSYTENQYVAISDLRYLKMLCYGIDGNTYVGEMIVNVKIADTVLEIFQKLYENQYPIERMVLVDNYQADDESSMSANNTSAFNYRPIAGSSKLSKHSYGLAIDINPKYNPYVKTATDGTTICQPANGTDYIDRSKEFTYKIDENDLAYQLFTEAGFTWGGSWNSLKDYQHFEMGE